MNQLLHIAFNDVRLIFRDTTLRIFFVIPLLLFGVVIGLLPSLVEQHEVLTPYISLFIILAIFENTQAFCIVMTMVLIEEKETNVAKVYGVLPVSRAALTLTRFLIPYGFTVLLNIVFLFVQPFYIINLWITIAISLFSALMIPIYALTINAIVKNKIEGLMYLKVLNILVLIPFAAFFVPESYLPFFWTFPTHWFFQGLHQLFSGEACLFSLTIALFSFLLVFGLSFKYFLKNHFE